MAVNIVERIDDAVRIRHVLLSVSDKSGLDRFVPGLLEVCPDVRLYSTGGTYSALRTLLGAAADRHLQQVSDYTGQPEMQGGLVKTLDFRIYLGLLSETYNEAHAADLARTRAVPLDLVVVNLYPFAATVARPEATPESARANIDIGGPCMVRASAKNYLRVASVTNPGSYDRILAELRRTGGWLSLRTRHELARQAFAHTAAYDAAIAEYLVRCDFDEVRRCYTLVNAGQHV
jgi:phosphoribosylaminoimidazolecarboxamide formyltransferase/IMP cyclohydrolase